MNQTPTLPSPAAARPGFGFFTRLAQEWRLLLRQRSVLLALALLFALSALAVLAGLRETTAQQAAIDRVQQMQQAETAQLAAHPSRSRDAGAAAYYGFHATWSTPAPASFLALGLRDSSPYVLRVRALALQAQLHESESHNPELALLGRLDWAFVLVYLAPLFLITLLYDLVSAERAAGRLGLLRSLPGGTHALWLRRAGLRSALVFAALVLPVGAGALASGMQPGALLAVLGVAAGYLLFWTGLALWVAARPWPAATQAVVLAGAWALLTLVLPAVVQLAVQRAVPAHQGAELMLTQREAVHGAWDRPREDTLARFFQTHPQWRDTAPLPAGFHWKWYYAFQQLGDEHVAGLVAEYRTALLARQRWTDRAGWLLPPVAASNALHRVAGSDLPAQLAYQDAVAAFHERLRNALYPYLFKDQAFGPQDMARQPRFEPASPAAAQPLAALLALWLGALALGWAGLRGLENALD